MRRTSWLPVLLIAFFFRCSDSDVSKAKHPPAGDSSRAKDKSADAISDVKSPAAIAVKRKAGSDWPCFLGPTGDSKSAERGILTKWPKQGPPIIWQRSLGAGYSMATISRGRLFQFDRQGNQARLVCLESETGKFLWKFEYPTEYEDRYQYENGPRASPVVDEDRVYILGAEGMLHCLSVADGEPLWKIDTAEDFHVIQNFFGVGNTPVVEGDLLIAQIGGSRPGSIESTIGDGSGIVAFDKRTGKVRYQITDELASYASPKLATIDGRRWCFVFARGGLVGFDPTSGKVDFQYAWRAPIRESVNASTPVVVGDEVFISETYGPGSSLLKVRPGGCDVVWADSRERREKAMQTHWNTPILHEGYLYGSSGRHTENAELRCIELATGKVQWSEPNLTRSSLLYADGHFICLSEDGVLRLIKATPEKFDVVAETVLVDASAGPSSAAARLVKPPAWAAPVLSHGLLYVRGRDRLVCLELIPPDSAGKTPQ